MKTTLPLTLQLTQPTEMASSLEEVLKESWHVETTKYNPETQVRETAEGVAMVYNGGHGGTSSNNNTQSLNALGIQVDVSVDAQVDDNL